MQLAHWTLEDLLATNLVEFKAEARLCYKVSLPQLYGKLSSVHWEFIDDVGALQLVDEDDEDFDAIQALGRRVRSLLQSLGFGYHKEAYGASVVTLGHEISPATFGVRAQRPLLWRAIGATEELLRRRSAKPSVLEALVSTWTWVMTATRPAFAIWGAVYGVTTLARDADLEQPLTDDVLAELQTALFLAPFLSARMDLSWAETVLMTDASEHGGAVVATEASLDEIRDEATFAETRGWHVVLEELPDSLENSTPWMSTATFDPQPAPAPIKTLRFLHLFSGPRRDGDLEYYVKEVAANRGVSVVVESIDVAISASCNLLNDHFFSALLAAAEAGVFAMVHAKPLCRTWSRTRFRRPGPPVLRTRRELDGVPHLSRSDKQKVFDDTLLLKRTVDVCRAVASRGGLFSIENPEDPGKDPFPSIFVCPYLGALRDDFGAFDICFDQCMLGMQCQTPTQILTNLQALRNWQGLRCRHGGPAHRTAEGQGAGGRYPREFYRQLALLYAEAFETLPAAVNETQEAYSALPSEVERRWVSRRVPPASKTWDSLDRWHERFRVKWDRPEHINVLELRTAVLGLRHLARARGCWDRRILCFTDSLVTLGVLAKGRSSSPVLLGLARAAAAMQLVLGLRPYWRHIETDRNHADGPSRGFPLGHAPAWATSTTGAA